MEKYSILESRFQFRHFREDFVQIFERIYHIDEKSLDVPTNSNEKCVAERHRANHKKCSDRFDEPCYNITNCGMLVVRSPMDRGTI